jgi:hypothetical protein
MVLLVPEIMSVPYPERERAKVETNPGLEPGSGLWAPILVWTQSLTSNGVSCLPLKHVFSTYCGLSAQPFYTISLFSCHRSMPQFTDKDTEAPRG